MATKPSILLIHGAWHTPACYTKLSSLLSEAGYPVVTPANPSSPAPPPVGLIEDGKAIEAVLEKLVEEEGKDVLVIGHSYGGMVLSQGVLEKFAKKVREAENKLGGVIRIVYLCAFIMGRGMSMATIFKPLTGDENKLPSRTPIDEEGYVHMNDPADAFYYDMSEADQKYWVGELVKQPAVCQFTKLTNAAWEHHPTSYWFCSDDHAIPYEIQQIMVNQVKTLKPDLQTEILQAGHSPFLTQPEKMVELVDKTLSAGY